MKRFAPLVLLTLLTAMTAACGDPEAAIEAPETMPGCDGQAWCAAEEACYLEEPGIELLDDDLSLVLGPQNGVHVDLPLRLFGRVDGERVDVIILQDGAPLDPLEDPYFYYVGEGCGGELRWLPDWDAELRIYGSSTEHYELIIRMDTWRGPIERRFPVHISD